MFVSDMSRVKVVMWIVKLEDDPHTDQPHTRVYPANGINFISETFVSQLNEMFIKICINYY